MFLKINSAHKEVTSKGDTAGILLVCCLSFPARHVCPPFLTLPLSLLLSRFNGHSFSPTAHE